MDSLIDGLLDLNFTNLISACIPNFMIKICQLQVEPIKTSPTSVALNGFPQPPTSVPYWHWEHHPDVVQPINGNNSFIS